MTFGAWINFGTEATGFSTLFPGIKLSMLTLSANFKLPILRDLFMALGMASVSRTSIESIFRQGPGHSVAIVIGGAQESLYAAPHTLDLVLNKRLGFIKVAILNGALLVPALTFGENEVFDLTIMPEGSIGRQMQQWSKQTFGWAMPAYRGRRVFPLGTLPYQHRITTVMAKAVDPEEVVGRPIDPHSLTKEELLEITQKVHQAYIDRVYEVWNKYKDELAPDRIKELELVE
ncbi:diacylglycerol O-acyltransferase 1 [Allomyces javanicus]|nr:diacylglycerol O-acyltransferase 1 [Allomyces javanicus]